MEEKMEGNENKGRWKGSDRAWASIGNAGRGGSEDLEGRGNVLPHFILKSET